MSGASKRSHEDGGHSTPLKRAHDGTNSFSSLSGKTVQLLGNDFHLSFEPGHDTRSTKFQRIEPRDGDKRSLHRMSTSPSHCMDNPSTSENRSELKTSKDARESKTEGRENMADNREPCTDTKLEYQVGKAESDARDARGNEKELRSDRCSYSDFKGIVKFERESYGVSVSHPSWKDSKEHIWAKRYAEPSCEGVESWRISRHLQNTIELGKDQSTRVEGVSENKVDLKAEEKLREKDKKKKDDRCRDFGEWDKDRSERRGGIQTGETSHDHKELKEERELDRWERERKDVQKDREQNDQDKDIVKRESPNPYEKEAFRFVKEIPEGSTKIFDQSISSSDLKWAKEDSWKGSEKDLRDKRREKDADVGDGYGQYGKCYDKEFEDGVEGDGAMERDRDAFSYGIQQRRRMLRSRGANQASQREPRFRSRARDIDGSQGKHDVSTVVYRVGECMQEILRTWREFEASYESKNTDTCQNYPTLEIRIPVEYVTSTNRQVRGAQLWGTDVYTNDSDLVAVLMHTGFCCPTSTSAPSSIHELRATIRMLPSQECYLSSLRNNVRSRSWGAGIGCSFRVERCCIVKKGGNTIDLEPRRTHVSTVEPTIAPVSAERTMTTRAAASNALRQQRFVREVTVQYNLCNEPWLKYSINIVADKGLKKPLYTSARLKKGEVLYLETQYNRYELCFNGERAVCNGMTSSYAQLSEPGQDKQQNQPTQNGDKHLLEHENITDVYRWSRCKNALPQDLMHFMGIPLPIEHLEVLEENLDWEDVQWSQTGVWVSGKKYVLARVHFLSPNLS